MVNFHQDSQAILAAETHSFSGKTLGQYSALIEALIEVKRAAASANFKAGLLNENELAVIQERLVDLVQARPALFMVDPLQGGGGIAINTCINEAIAHPKANLSQSTSDVVATAGRIALIGLADGLEKEGRQLWTAFKGLAHEHQDTVTLGRTCLRDAGKTTMGNLFGGYQRLLGRSMDELERGAQDLRVNLGGTAIGTSEGAPSAYRHEVRKALQVSYPALEWHDHLPDGAQNSDDLIGLSSVIERYARGLMKIARDLRLLNSGPGGGFAQIHLPKIIKGSSFYKGKSNPTIPETVIQCGYQVLGLCHSAELGLGDGELDLNVFEPSAVVYLYEALESLKNVTKMFHIQCVNHLIVDRERCRSLLGALERVQ
jgi:aspartate ammonia-lyase